MGGIVFSTIEAAVAAAQELKDEIDSDVHVILRRYPSGEEYSLSQFWRENCAYVARVLPSHIFQGTKEGKKKAFEYAKRFNMFVKQNKVTQNGYTFTKSHTLVNEIPEEDV
jgi:hypothetical protein